MYSGIYTVYIYQPQVALLPTPFPTSTPFPYPPTSTPEPTPTPSPTPIPTGTPTPSPTPKPSPTATPAPSPTPIQVINTPPSSGYKQQYVKSKNGTFLVDIIAGNLNNTKVIVDTASDSDCSNGCPTYSLATYVSRTGAYAGINGTYFCPIDYSQCAGKTNSFDTLLMNRSKYYFNSLNNIFSTVPIAVFKDNWSRFMAYTYEWGRDTSVDAVVAMQPLLVLNGKVQFVNSSDPKHNSKGPRAFLAGEGNMAYIGFVYNANMSDSAQVLYSLGIDNAINLDEGGSSALWYQGRYLLGPGRSVPNVVLFLSK